MSTLVIQPVTAQASNGSVLNTPPDPSILERNLRSLARTSARAVEMIRASAPSIDARFLMTDQGVPTVELVDIFRPDQWRALASRRRPLDEAKLITAGIDLTSTATVAVMGFGAGYHVSELARRMRRTGVIVVFEPDIALLRAVLERIDHSTWFESSNVVVFTDPDDQALMSASLQGVEGILMMGMELLEHAPSVDRLAPTKTRFYTNLQEVIRAVRTTVATTMVQAKTTVNNVSRNIGWYASRPGIADLSGSASGKPAIIVSAGPSLQRNIEELTDERVRDRFIIVATQTTLKPLLARGIKPHYVMALDYSEISARFYEGLSEEQTRGVTLVVEPKVSPAVPAAFPGEIRVTHDPFLDKLLGPELAPPKGSLQPGATVAHLAYYFARHLGCDPVVLVGQDLGFTDGQYYAAGASIHDVWACELNEFNTLEMMEWERVKRMGSNLRRATDHQGRPVYTDEQMATYLVQFERDFAADTRRGLTVIDATEGGVAKRHTTVERLRDVIADVLRSPGPEASPPVRATESKPVTRKGLRRVEDRVRHVQADVWRIAEISDRAAAVLREMAEHHEDQARVNRLIDQVDKLRDQAESLKPAIDLVHFLNQTGAFTRIRADRAIHLDDSMTPLERQRKEIERDTANVEQLSSTARELAAMLSRSADIVARWECGSKAIVPGESTTVAVKPSASIDRGSVVALIALDPAVSGLGRPRDLAAEIVQGKNALRLTLERLAHCRNIERVVILADDVEAAQRLAGGRIDRLNVSFRRPSKNVFDEQTTAFRSARRWSASCWRGGIAHTTVFDEVLSPEPMLEALIDLGASAAFIVGADWCMLDPEICDAVIDRRLSDQANHHVSFSQAPPGIAGAVISRRVLQDLVSLRRSQSLFGSIGALIGYLPTAPALDPIGKPMCAPVDPALRDCGWRLIPDSPARARWIADLLHAFGPSRDAAKLAVGLTARPGPACDHAVIDLNTLRPQAVDAVLAQLSVLAHEAPDLAISIRTSGAEFNAVKRVMEEARRLGIDAIHVRVPATATPAFMDQLASLHPTVVSIDVPPASARDAGRVQAIINTFKSASGSGAHRAWIVPRLSKTDASAESVEVFYDTWLMATGSAVIDPSNTDRPDARIQPLPVPGSARARLQRSTRVLDGGTR